MVGEAVISLLDHEEEYKITFPSGYGRSVRPFSANSLF